MRSDAKASSAGSTSGQPNSIGSFIGETPLALREVFCGASGRSGLSPRSTQIALLGVLALTVAISLGAIPAFAAAAAPKAETVYPADLTPSSALLGGLVNAGGTATTFYFEIGTDTGYGASVPASEDGEAGEGSAPTLVTQQVASLQPHTTYHYRIVAENAEGTVLGADRSFTTDDPTASGPPERGIELVNTPNKGNQDIAFAGNFLSPDGNQITWTVTAGAPDSTVGSGNAYLSTRGVDGWTSINLIPPAEGQAGEGTLRYSLLRASTNLSHFLFMANEGTLALAPYLLTREDQYQHEEVLASLPPQNLTQAATSIDTTEDLAHVVTVDPGDDQLYDYGSGTPEPVGLMPDGTAPTCGISINFREFRPEADHWMSAANAAYIYFMTKGNECESAAQIYVRDRAANATTLVSGPPVSGTLGQTRLLKINPAGTSVVYITNTKLTPDDTNTTRDIYRYTVGTGNSCLTCVAPVPANVDWSGLQTLDPRIVVSNDLSHVYFTSTASLVPGEGAFGGKGLFVWHDGVIDYVAPSAGTGKRQFGSTKSQLSDDGTVLTYYAREFGLTADPEGQCEGFLGGTSPCLEFYRYDSDRHELRCLSCVIGGSPEVQEADESGPHFKASPDGETVIFRTGARLLSADVNGGLDIYEWRDGQARLVTDGLTSFPHDTGGKPTIRGMDADSSDVFFSVAAPLTGFEGDGNSNLYDARIGGGFELNTPPAGCVEDSCQGPLLPSPSVQVPGSATFYGAGNQHLKKKKKAAHRKRKKRAGKHRRQEQRRNVHRQSERG